MHLRKVSAHVSPQSAQADIGRNFTLSLNFSYQKINFTVMNTLVEDKIEFVNPQVGDALLGIMI